MKYQPMQNQLRCTSCEIPNHRWPIPFYDCLP